RRGRRKRVLRVNPLPPNPPDPGIQNFAEQGVGSHFAPSGSFLKCTDVIQGVWRLAGSSTTLVTTSQSVLFGGPVSTSQYSVKTVFALYGTPFFRKYPARSRVVTDLSEPRRGAPARPRPAAITHCAVVTP